MHLASRTSDSDAPIPERAQLGQKPVRRFSFSLADLFLFATFIVLILGVLLLIRQNRNAQHEISWLKQQLDQESVIQIDYDYITLFQIDQDIYALRVTPAMSGSADKVEYEWIRVPDSNEINGLSSWKEVFDRQIQTNRGHGSLEETNNRTQLEIGPITIQWSRGGPDHGWLYLSEVRKLDSGQPIKMAIYRSQIVTLDQIGHLQSSLWKSWPLEVDRE